MVSGDGVAWRAKEGASVIMIGRVGKLGPHPAKNLCSMPHVALHVNGKGRAASAVGKRGGVQVREAAISK